MKSSGGWLCIASIILGLEATTPFTITTSLQIISLLVTLHYNLSTKMTDAYPERSQSPGGNHPRTSSMGGSGSVPTPANNVGGGTGWGDKGFFKGGSGTEGPGHANVCYTLSKRREEN